LRDYKVAATQFNANFEWLESKGWQSIIERCNTLLNESSASEEREVARYLADTLKGIGPKQARNILQGLALTRFEIPLDSRVIRWLQSRLEFPIPINARLLADSDYYEFVLDAVQSLCRKCSVFPCMLDAAIFSESDPDDWTSEMMAF
jgi:hypothetical protein